MTGVNKKSQQERALLQVMQREIERLEEERIQLKTENRKMAVQLGHKAAQLGLDAQDLKAIQEYRDALKERRRNMSLLMRKRPIYERLRGQLDLFLAQKLSIYT